VQQERDVAAEVCRELFERRPAQTHRPQLIGGDQRSRGVRAATGQPTAHRDGLAQGQLGGRGDTGPFGDRPHGLSREVVIVERNPVGVLSDHLHP
jgi:hypothetical protein